MGYAEALELFTDVRKVRQILVNLLANAIKFSTSGDIVLLLRFVADDIDPLVYFEVIDRGRGIAVEDHEHIFDAFWQDDPAIVHTMGSTGLGLSVARELARLLGGDEHVRGGAASEVREAGRTRVRIYGLIGTIPPMNR